MRHTVYDTNTYLVEIEDTRPYGSNGVITTTWNWQITIAVYQTTYKGQAIENNRDASINWVELNSNNPVEEMIGICKGYIQNNS